MGRDRPSADDAPPLSEEPPLRPRSTTIQSKRRRRRQLLNKLRPLSPDQAGQPAAAGGLTPEAIDKLKQLGELHEQNVLSDEEFEREKAKLLGPALQRQPARPDKHRFGILSLHAKQ